MDQAKLLILFLRSQELQISPSKLLSWGGKCTWSPHKLENSQQKKKKRSPYGEQEEKLLNVILSPHSQLRQAEVFALSCLAQYQAPQVLDLSLGWLQDRELGNETERGHLVLGVRERESRQGDAVQVTVTRKHPTPPKSGLAVLF